MSRVDISYNILNVKKNHLHLITRFLQVHQNNSSEKNIDISLLIWRSFTLFLWPYNTNRFPFLVSAMATCPAQSRASIILGLLCLFPFIIYCLQNCNTNINTVWWVIIKMFKSTRGENYIVPISWHMRRERSMMSRCECSRNLRFWHIRQHKINN